MNRWISVVVLGLGIIVSSCNTNKVVQTVPTGSDTLSEEKEMEYYFTFIEANKQKLLGNYTRATALFYQCLEIDENSGAAMYEISNINMVLKNYEVALKYAKKAVDTDIENKWYNLHLAKLYLMKKEFKNAIPLYERVVSYNPNDLNLKFNLIGLYQQTQNPIAAIQVLDEIEEKKGVSETVSLAKQQIYWGMGERNKAYEEVHKLTQHYPFEPQFYGLLGELYLEDEKFDLAEQYYLKLFEIDSTNHMGQISIIDLYRKKQNYERVFHYVDKAIDNPGIESGAKVMVVVSFLNNRQEYDRYYDKINDLILDLKNLYPDNTDMYTIHADYFLKNNKYSEAVIELDYVTKNQPFNLIIWDQLISLYGYMGDFEKMYETSSKAIDSVKNNANIYLYHGIASSQVEKFEEAVETLTQGINYVNSDPATKVQFYMYLGEAYHNLNNHSQSDYYFEKVIGIDPNNMMVLNNYSYYLSLREEKLDRAAEYSKRTIDEEPTNSTYLDTYAWILYKQEKYNEALKYIKMAFENGGAENFEIIDHFGDILYAKGEKDEALKYWKTAKDLGKIDIALDEKIRDAENME